ncbi:cysteine-rich receptor-like protein kinase 2 [Chenopodium quinoa]|uniref:Cysteine-rich receptor-like protein kinase 2 n=1 Tax=Chenopodium quinoa TaxID=63459 RepID=A0A803LJD9_CHEQI|nr:cysteine-rich receptor-like protein kinase 2 [Chenopodium quinoa]
MKKASSPILSPQIFIPLVTAIIWVKMSMGDPRIQTVKIICGNQVQKNSPPYIKNFVTTMGNLSNLVRTSGFGESVSGSAPYTNYGLAQCYGDLSSLDCVLCYAQARTALPQCFPSTGGRIYLDGCYARSENYNFYDEYLGSTDTAVCGNRTRAKPAFVEAARRAVMQAVANAPKNKGYAREKVLVTGDGNETAYVLANCWESLNISSCQLCLRSASSKILRCLPSSEGRALNTGCFIRYSNVNFLNNDSKSGISKGTIRVIAVSVTSTVILLAIGIAAGIHFRKLWRIKKKRRGSNDAEELVQMLHDSSLNFKYSTLEKATNSFAEANKLGQGGFGTVYKGVLADGREIAVKRLFLNNKHRAADFYNEVNIISGLQHNNLVRLLGCSCSGPESLLVYEFLPNKSLDHFIFDPLLGRTLNWKKRYGIMIGTAEGLAYLHENAITRIIHRDIKASNILLDAKFRAKIADFGLARTFQDDKSHISTAIAGTQGYMAPEYLAHGQLTEKADVYSFGVLLLEIVTGMQNNRTKNEDNSESIIASTWKHFQKCTLEGILDPNLTPPEENEGNVKEEAMRVLHVGLLCTQEVPSLRPSMSTTVQMLKMKERHLPPPSSPPFIDERTMELNDMCENPNYPLRGESSSSIATLAFSSFHGR